MHSSSLLLHRLRLTAVCVCLCFFLAGCEGYQRSLDLSIRAIGDFHRHFDAEHFDRLLDGLHPILKTPERRDSVATVITELRRALGRVSTTQLSSWKMSNGQGLTRMDLEFESEFEAGSGKESFVVLVERGRAMVADYTVDSPALRGLIGEGGIR